MKCPSSRKSLLEKMPLDIKAELALREAVAGAIAEHKLRGHPIIVWRDGKVVSIPPEMIPVAANGSEKTDWREPERLSVKEKKQSYGKTKKPSKQ